MKLCIYCQSDISNKEWRYQKYCNNHCQRELEYRQRIDKWLAGTIPGNKAIGEVAPWVRRWLTEAHGNKCEKCGWNKVHPITNKVPLQVNHIDGNWNNTTPNNLELLCPCCHALTPNYGSLNKGRGRPNRNKGN